MENQTEQQKGTDLEEKVEEAPTENKLGFKDYINLGLQCLAAGAAMSVFLYGLQTILMEFEPHRYKDSYTLVPVSEVKASDVNDIDSEYDLDKFPQELLIKKEDDFYRITDDKKLEEVEVVMKEFTTVSHSGQPFGAVVTRYEMPLIIIDEQAPLNGGD